MPDRTLPDDQFHVATRRGKQFNSIVQDDHDGLTGAERDHVFMSRADMERLGLRPDQAIVLRNDHGAMPGRVFEAPITPGSLQVHWPEATVLIDADRVDPGGRVPDYNAVVRVEPA